GMRFDETFMKNSRQYGIRVTPVDHHSIRKGEHNNKLLLGYGHLEPDEIRKGISLLHDFMNDYKSN
ncbi:MAG: PLP-dependent aminotransferase family protein, partial [Paenibacillus sp.]|nr:PLP-dependent aminotransferase family protein [Paenibacillus sp.]